MVFYSHKVPKENFNILKISVFWCCDYYLCDGNANGLKKMGG